MKSRLLRMLLIVLALSANRLVAEPLGHAFTYQGRLNDNGAPVDGSYDLKFTLYDLAGGGTSVINAPLTNAATRFARYAAAAGGVTSGIQRDGIHNPLIVNSPPGNPFNCPH